MMNRYLSSLVVIMAMGLVTWLYTVFRRNVTIVDSLWSLMFLAAAITFVAFNGGFDPRSLFVFSLISLWALRLSIFLSLRNWGHPEDQRYQEIRKNNEPFWIKSLYIVFGLQGLLAWIIAVPLFVALKKDVSFHGLDVIALAFWTTGFLFEAVSDWQLFKFKNQPSNRGKVLNSGLWAYTRHPNYFGEFLIWWGYFLLAVPAGGWWTLYAPLLMTFLLLKVSGVGLMEKTITSRRPDYAAYAKQTNTFFPGRPHREEAQP